MSVDGGGAAGGGAAGGGAAGGSRRGTAASSRSSFVVHRPRPVGQTLFEFVKTVLIYWNAQLETVEKKGSMMVVLGKAKPPTTWGGRTRSAIIAIALVVV